MTVLAFVNLWGYSELKAALAITPVAVMGAARRPRGGRVSEPAPAPRVFGVPALVVMAVGALLALARCPPEPDLLRAVWRSGAHGRRRGRHVPGRVDRLDGLDQRPGAGPRVGHREHVAPGRVRDRRRAARGRLHRHDRRRNPALRSRTVAELRADRRNAGASARAVAAITTRKSSYARSCTTPLETPRQA